MVALLAQDDFACRGVRSLQRMRRSSSTSALRCRQAPRHEFLASDLLSANMAKLSTKSPSYAQLKAFKSELRTPPAVVALSAPQVAPVEPGPLAVTALESVAPAAKEGQTHLGQPVHSELLGDALEAAQKVVATYCRVWHFPLEGYELFCFPTNGAAQFDDKERRQLFGRDIFAYEELLILGGPDALLDDECPKPLEVVAPFSYYCRQLHGYEELLLVAGPEASLDT